MLAAFFRDFTSRADYDGTRNPRSILDVTRRTPLDWAVLDPQSRHASASLEVLEVIAFRSLGA
jgi:hypothetical protein